MTTTITATITLTLDGKADTIAAIVPHLVDYLQDKTGAAADIDDYVLLEHAAPEYPEYDYDDLEEGDEVTPAMAAYEAWTLPFGAWT